MPRSLLGLWLSVLAAGLVAGNLAAQQDLVHVGVKVPGGKVAVSYTPADLRGRSISKDLKVGDVWRMSAGPAAELDTEVPLMHGTTVIAPGKHRLSARYLGGQRFTLMLFRGPHVYTKGTPYREIPLRFHEHERSREKLSFRVLLDTEEGPKGEVRFRTHWGKQSLNFNLQVLPLVKAKWTLAGKPATLTFFELPRNKKVVDQVKAGIRVHFGMLVQDGGGIRYDLWGVNTSRGYRVECRNFTVPDARLHIEALEATATRLQKFIEEAKRDDLKERLAMLREGIATSRKTLEKAEGLPRKVRIDCQMRRNPEPGQVLRVETEPGKDDAAQDGTLRILLHFGIRTAACTLDPKDFRG